MNELDKIAKIFSLKDLYILLMATKSKGEIVMSNIERSKLIEKVHKFFS